MYKLCKTEQSARRQRELEEGLLAAMGSQRYEEISVSSLCDELGIPRKAFYRYFDSKDGALVALIDHTIMEFDSEAMADRTREQMDAHSYMKAVLEHWIRNKPLLDALACSGLSSVLVQRANEHTRKMNSIPLLVMGMDRKLRDYGSMFIVCGLMSMIVQWHHDGFSPDVDRMAGLIVRLLSEPIFSQPIK